MDTLEKRAIQNLWFKMAESNRGCDVVIVDSCSSMLPHVPSSVWYYGFEDNVGHLSRGGRDGWGRAFCHGLSFAAERDYDWVVHVECDSLCNLDIVAEVENMELRGDCVATIPVSSMPKWPETGLMFFSVDWLRASHFVQGYDWANRPRRPEPEVHVRDLVGRDMTYMETHGMRDDFHELTVDNVNDRKLSWLTHAPLPVMERFAS